MKSSDEAVAHQMKRIRLNAARSKTLPAGSTQHGYEFVRPLDAAGHIDLTMWRAQRDHCRIIRFWDGEENQIGRLVHKPGGHEHTRWVFDYNPDNTGDDEAGFRFGSHQFEPGEYVTIWSEDGDQTFQVVSVESVA